MQKRRFVYNNNAFGAYLSIFHAYLGIFHAQPTTQVPPTPQATVQCRRKHGDLLVIFMHEIWQVWVVPQPSRFPSWHLIASYCS